MDVESIDMASCFFRGLIAAVALALAGCAAVPAPGPAGSVSTSTTAVKPKPSLGVPPSLDAPLDLPVAVPAIDTPPIDTAYSAAGRELERGGASWYGPGFHGKRTASGERYDMNALTAAHKTLPFDTMVRVKSLVNGREVLVRITDRGPFIRNRVIDLSRAAAAELDMLGLGFKQVVLMVRRGRLLANLLRW